MYRGIIKEVFIPGLVNKEGMYSAVIEAAFIGFRIELTEGISEDKSIFDAPFVGKTITLIEPDTKETAQFCRGDVVLINSAYFYDPTVCTDGATDAPTFMILSLSSKPHLKRVNV